MNVPLKPKPMTVDEFIPWAIAQPRGRFELFNGEVVQMNAERARHWRCKAAVFDALRAALKASRLAGEVALDGATVRINKQTAFEPDVLMYLGPMVDGAEVEISNPIIVAEVVSPSTSGIDSGAKLRGYFTLASVHHYLVIDPLERSLTHHRRGVDGAVVSETWTTGDVSLNPPGLDIAVADFFPPS